MYTCVYKHVHLHTCMYKHIYMYIYIHLYIYMHTNTYLHIYVYVCIYTYIYVYTYISIYIHIYLLQNQLHSVSVLYVCMCDMYICVSEVSMLLNLVIVCVCAQSGEDA